MTTSTEGSVDIKTGASCAGNVEGIDRFLEEHTAVLIVNHRLGHDWLSKAVVEDHAGRPGGNGTPFDL